MTSGVYLTLKCMGEKHGVHTPWCCRLYPVVLSSILCLLLNLSNLVISHIVRFTKCQPSYPLLLSPSDLSLLIYHLCFLQIILFVFITFVLLLPPFAYLSLVSISLFLSLLFISSCHLPCFNTFVCAISSHCFFITSPLFIACFSSHCFFITLPLFIACFWSFFFSPLISPSLCVCHFTSSSLVVVCCLL